MKDKRALVKEELEKIIEKMDSAVDAALVEGRRDRKALRKMGFTKPVIDCSSLAGGEAAEKLMELGARNVAMLTDYDFHGRSLCRDLTRALQMRGIRIKSLYRKKIKETFAERNMKTIESMNKL
jgi:5S rRNA maturation endonuclease (ribonuclease M5)